MAAKSSFVSHPADATPASVPTNARRLIQASYLECDDLSPLFFPGSELISDRQHCSQFRPSKIENIRRKVQPLVINTCQNAALYFERRLICLGALLCDSYAKPVHRCTAELGPAVKKALVVFRIEKILALAIDCESTPRK